MRRICVLMCLVLGACAVVLPSVLEARLAIRELLWLFGSLALIWFFAWDLAITRVETSWLAIDQELPLDLLCHALAPVGATPSGARVYNELVVAEIKFWGRPSG